MLKQVGEQFLNIRSGSGATGAKAQYRGGELSCRKKNNNFRLISHHLNVCCFYLLPPISPHGRSASLQVRFVWPAPAAWSTQQWWPSLQLQAPVKLWPSASCSSYWEPAHTSRGARVPPTNWCKVWPRQRPNRST